MSQTDLIVSLKCFPPNKESPCTQRSKPDISLYLTLPHHLVVFVCCFCLKTQSQAPYRINFKSLSLSSKVFIWSSFYGVLLLFFMLYWANSLKTLLNAASLHFHSILCIPLARNSLKSTEIFSLYICISLKNISSWRAELCFTLPCVSHPNHRGSNIMPST